MDRALHEKRVPERALAAIPIDLHPGGVVERNDISKRASKAHF